MERTEIERFRNRIKLIFISSLIAVFCAPVSFNIQKYEEHYFNHFHPHGDLDFCNKGHFVYYLTSVLFYGSLGYILLAMLISMLVFIKAIRTFPLTDKKKKIIIGLTIGQGLFMIITPILIFNVCLAAINTSILAILLWLVNLGVTYYLSSNSLKH